MKSHFSRVDRQVSALIAIMLTISILLTYAVCMFNSFQSSLNTLEARIQAVYRITEEMLNLKEYSDLSSKEDRYSEEYIYARNELQKIREMAGVRYLYTAGRDAEGKLVYMVDGLPLDENGNPLDPEDYRYPGDPIEAEIQEPVERALAGEEILPKGIVNTSWGSVFVAYFPIHSHEGEVLAVLGLEYSADQEIANFRRVALLSLIIGIYLIVMATMISIKIFHRISNPLYKDLSSTDFLTKLKNRNTYERDLDNLMNAGAGPGITIGLLDLNELKKANDNFGHDMGDRYIEAIGKALGAVETENCIPYRYGGDEFILLCKNRQNMESLTERLEQEFRNSSRDIPFEVSFAFDYAEFDETQDKNLMDTQSRADQRMYERKRKMKAEKAARMQQL